MRGTFVTCTILAFALTGAFASSASAQNPFLIDGVVTDASNSKATGAAAQAEDGHGNAKELGPAQGTATKFPVIHSATPNMLGSSNPNPGTDLHLVYTQTEKVGADSWFYFGWTRDSNSGSGFISFEAHQEPNTCASYSAEDLALCNPFSPRTAGDFVIFWDQSGSSTNVYLRVWNGSSFQPGQPGLLLDPSVAIAQYSADLSKGELALNLTAAGVVNPNECKAFANVIPGTITGNSQGDQADYKDVVLAPISINTCGAITVTKVTKGPDGKTVADLTSNFSYTLKKAATVIANVTIKGCTQSDPQPCNGEVDTYADQNPGSDYTLQENTPLPGKYLIESIVCGGASTTTVGPLTFTVPESGSVACTITNRIPLGDPTLVTTPSVKFVLYDDVQVTLENPLPDGTTVTGVTFALFPDAPGAQCTGTPLATRTRSVTFNASGVGSATTLPGGPETIPNTNTGILIVTPGKYFWQVSYPGDSLNNAATTCGEATTVSVQFD